MASMKSDSKDANEEDSSKHREPGPWFLTPCVDFAAAESKYSVDSDTYGADDLVCRLCRKLVADAVTTYCCQTLYCRPCVMHALRTKSVCPHCSTVLDFGGLHDDIRAERRSAAHERRCQFHESGCCFRGNRSEMKDHCTNSCLYSPEKRANDHRIELIRQSSRAWETGNPHLQAFKELYFPNTPVSEASESEAESPITRLVPSAVKFLHVGDSMLSHSIHSGLVDASSVSVGPWKLTWLVEYRWKLHAIFYVSRRRKVHLIFYKDIGIPSSIVSRVKLISPVEPKKSIVFSTSGEDLSKWTAGKISTIIPGASNSSKEDVVVNIWDCGEIMSLDRFEEFVSHGKLAVAAMLEH